MDIKYKSWQGNNESLLEVHFYNNTLELLIGNDEECLDGSTCSHGTGLTINQVKELREYLNQVLEKEL